MNKLVKSLVIGVTAIGLTVASLATSADARPFGRRHHHNGGGALAAGIAIGVTGLILSQALRDSHRSRAYYYYNDGYYDDDGYAVSCRRLAWRCDNGGRRACREWRRYCD